MIKKDKTVNSEYLIEGWPRKVYTPWAFTENEQEKGKVNFEYFKLLKNEYSIKVISQSDYEANRDHINQTFPEDIVYYNISGYAHYRVVVVKRPPELTDDEVALIIDGGNLCFGYSKEGSRVYHIYTD